METQHWKQRRPHKNVEHTLFRLVCQNKDKPVRPIKQLQSFTPSPCTPTQVRRIQWYQPTTDETKTAPNC